jgi:glycosyltransferase involved in cell wall biosynthesis
VSSSDAAAGGDHPRAVSLVVSTYNWPAALAVVLEAIRRQRVRPHEVLVADDGSRDDTRALVERVASTFPVPLHHVWHEDRGFRAGAIRNRAIARARGDYVLQIDGDIVLHEQAVAAHVQWARRGSFVQGSRALLNEARTNALLESGLAPLGPWSRGVSHRLNAWYAPPLAPWSGGTRDTVERIRGCHIAFWRDDLLRVNGYDEAYEGWGREDSDLTLRLGHAGVVRRNLKFAAVAFHLWHREQSRRDMARNDALLTEARRTRRVRAVRGLDQYLAEAPDVPGPSRLTVPEHP